MTPGVFIGLALAGGAGAASRFLVEGFIQAHTRDTFPWATVVINLTGSFCLGLITGLVAGGLLPRSWHLVVGTGFLGGYTTFSTASFETVRLLQQGKPLLGVVNGIGVIMATTALAGVGLGIGILASSGGT